MYCTSCPYNVVYHCMLEQEHIRTNGLSQACISNRSPGSGQNYWIVLKIDYMYLVTSLANMAYAYAACTIHVTIFSICGKFQPVSNFMELHALTQAARCTLSWDKSLLLFVAPGFTLLHSFDPMFQLFSLVPSFWEQLEEVQCIPPIIVAHKHVNISCAVWMLTKKPL